MSIAPFNQEDKLSRGELNRRFSAMLTDATAALYGMGKTATPDALFSKLSKALLQVSSGGALTSVTGGAVKIPVANLESDQISGLVRVNGSYVGTGTHGASAPNSLTFPSAPILVMLTGYSKGSTFTNYMQVNESSGFAKTWIIDPRLLTETFAKYHGFGVSSINTQTNYGKKSADGKTISWYNDYYQDNGSQQLNAAGITYYYVAML